MNKKIDVQKEMHGYTFNDFIEMTEKTKDKEEQRLYVNMLNAILEVEQMQVINK